MIQAGTAQHLLSGSPKYYFWYEIVHGPTDTGAEIKVSKAAQPGDAAATVVIWTPVSGQPGWGTVTFGICNFSLSTNQCTNIIIGNPDPNPIYSNTWTPTPGNSTEWIVEAPSGPESVYNGSILPLADFDHVGFVNAAWTSTYPGGTGYSIAQGSPSSIALQQYVFGAYQTLALPDALNSNGNGFFDYYLQPEKTGPCPTCMPVK